MRYSVGRAAPRSEAWEAWSFLVHYLTVLYDMAEQLADGGEDLKKAQVTSLCTNFFIAHTKQPTLITVYLHN